jgi:hypothetical protein
MDNSSDFPFDDLDEKREMTPSRSCTRAMR